MPTKQKQANYRDLLRSNSYKATPSRIAVLAVLDRAQKPVTGQDIIKKLGKRQSEQATVYRTLAALKDSGIVKQIDFRHGITYYELASLGEHHHVICTKCERVADVKDCCAETMEKIALKQSGFAEITHHSLEFFGICQECKA
jgi:Fur family ferric uptake transcriptional regulator